MIYSANNPDLTDLCILNTRPIMSNDAIAETITRYHGECLAFPTLSIKANSLSWLEQIPALSTIDYAIFISPNAVNYTFAALHEQEISWPASIKVAAIGRATANSLKALQVNVDFVPEDATSEQLINHIALENFTSKRVLLLKGNDGRTLIYNLLREKKAHVIPIEVYRRCLPPAHFSANQLAALLKKIDIILFTSEQGMQNFLILAGQVEQELLTALPCLVISKRLAFVAEQLGWRTILISPIDSIPETLSQFKKGSLHARRSTAHD